MDLLVLGLLQKILRGSGNTVLKFNILGQISLFSSIGWYFISLVGITLDDWLRYRLFGEKKPRYKLF